MVINLKYKYFVESSETVLCSCKTGKQASTSICEESVQSQEEIGVPILKNRSQSHFIVNSGGADGGAEDDYENDKDDDDIWREVIHE
jgi:hypothetical protein